MPKIVLTEISVRALKPTDGQVTYWDVNLPNFGVRVGKRRKTFVLLVGEARQRVSLERVDIHCVHMNALMTDSMERNALGVCS
jgi:hypothetical protein